RLSVIPEKSAGMRIPTSLTASREAAASR
ncbi:hypothetical protein DBR06_SOUSAS33210004, partial [Sousa chinensis]